jgi:hypothetical protein
MTWQLLWAVQTDPCPNTNDPCREGQIPTQLLENARGMLADVEVQIEAIERISEIVSTIQTAEVVDWIVGPSPIAETVGHRIQPAV